MIRIVIEVPDEHKELAAALTALTDQVTALAGRGADGKAVDYARIERTVGELVAATGRSPAPRR